MNAATSSVTYPPPGQPAAAQSSDEASTSTVEKSEGELRVATLHAGITADPASERPVEHLISSLGTGNHTQARAMAQTAQINNPDVLVLTGVTYDEDEQVADLLRTRYLASGQNSEDGLDYPYAFTAPTNSGRDSGVDLDGDGTIGGPGDAIGYGEYSGQYGMVIFSKYPIDESQVRTFQNFLWTDLPESSLPEDAYSQLEESVLRLQETSMWDVPVEVGDQVVHIVASSVADSGDSSTEVERRDDLRRLLADYASGNAWYLYDDDGQQGGLAPGHDLVVAGTPVVNSGSSENLTALLGSSALQDPEPEAVTETELSERPGLLSETDSVATRAVEFDEDPRASFVLPSATLDVSGSGVFWPGEGERGYEVVNPESAYALEDRLVWVDVSIAD